MKSKIKRSRLIAVLAASAAISLGGIALSGCEGGEDFVRPQKIQQQAGREGTGRYRKDGIEIQEPYYRTVLKCPKGYKLDGEFCYKN